MVFELFSFCSQIKESVQGFTKPCTFAIPWIYVPVASKLGLRPQTVSPRRHISSHGITQSFPMFCLCLFLCSFYYLSIKSL